MKMTGNTNNKDFFKALDYYHKSFIKYDYSATHPPYNMGLVYKLSEVSQDIDAADSFKRALNIDPKAGLPVFKPDDNLINIIVTDIKDFINKI